MEARTRREGNVDGFGERGLDEGVSEVDLCSVKTFCNGEREEETDGGPVDNRGVGVVEGSIKMLEIAADTEAGLVFGDGSVGFSFATEDPGRLDDLGTFLEGFSTVGKFEDGFGFEGVDFNVHRVVPEITFCGRTVDDFTPGR